MSHSITGREILFSASVGAMLMMVACGGTENGPIIGTPPTANLSVANSRPSLTQLEQDITNQLGAADVAAGDTQLSQLTGQADALVNDHSLLLAERIASLKQLGSSQISARESELQALSGDVRGSGLSSSQEYNVESVINQTEGELQSLGAKIAADTLIDVLRGDVLSIEIDSRVEGLVAPVVHIALSGYLLVNQAANLSGEASTLNSQIQSGNGLNIATEEQLLSSLEGDLGPMRSTGSSVAYQVLQQTPAGYPNNKSTLSSLKSEVNSVEAGDALPAQQAASQIKVCISYDAIPQACPL